jgi:hypothetical protein
MLKERRNLYRILHVQPEAPVEVIRASYRTLMSTLRAHPDLGGDVDTAARINAAYAVLIDPERRRAYDRSLQRIFLRPAPKAAESPQVMTDPAAWLADRICPFCRAPLPSALHTDTRCGQCGSPLMPRPVSDRGELFGRRRSPRNARSMAVTLRLPGRAGDLPGRLRDVSLSGLCVLSSLPAPVRGAMRVLTPGFDSVAAVVGCRREGEGWLLHGELLTLQLLRSQGVFVSARA